MRFALGLAAFAALAGCMASDDGLGMDVSWRDDSHAMMRMHNRGSGPMPMADMMAGMSMQGPNGTVPMFWGGGNGTMPMCRMGGGDAMMGGCGATHMAGLTLAPGESRTYAMHAGRWNGTWGMMVMPDGAMPMSHAGGHMPMMAGTYTWRMQGQESSATLTG